MYEIYKTWFLTKDRISLNHVRADDFFKNSKNQPDEFIYFIFLYKFLKEQESFRAQCEESTNSSLIHIKKRDFTWFF